MKQIDLQGNVYDIGIEDEFDKTMKDIKEHLIDRIKRQEKEIERLNNVLDNIGYQIEGIIKNNERIGITKATGEIISKHDIELLKNILKMIDSQDISIRGDKDE